MAYRKPEHTAGGLDWLEQAEALALRGQLSEDAVTLAAVLEYGWQPADKEGLLSNGTAFYRTGFNDWRRYSRAEKELRRAGLLTGRGKRTRHYRYHFRTETS